MDAVLDRISTRVDLDGLAAADLVIEAATDRWEVNPPLRGGHRLRRCRPIPLSCGMVNTALMDERRLRP